MKLPAWFIKIVSKCPEGYNDEAMEKIYTLFLTEKEKLGNRDYDRVFTWKKKLRTELGLPKNYEFDRYLHILFDNVHMDGPAIYKVIKFVDKELSRY